MIDTVHICIAMKPLDGNFAKNAIEHGVAGLWIDGGRIESHPRKTGTKLTCDTPTGAGATITGSSKNRQAEYDLENKGRWPANVITDGSDEVTEQFPESKGTGGDSAGAKGTRQKVGKYGYNAIHIERRNDDGSASRFFKTCEPDDENTQ